MTRQVSHEAQTPPPAGRERRAQKSRTREALLGGARALMAEGRPVTVSAAAACAGISKATAYRYFSDPAVLAAEAGLAVQVLDYAEVVQGADSLRDRLLAISLYFFDLALDHEAEFRQFLARSQDAWAAEGARGTGRRGARRIEMYLRALRDSPDPVVPRTKAALVNALSIATGVEAMIALLDVAGIDRAAARQTVRDLAEAAIDRHLGARGG